MHMGMRVSEGMREVGREYESVRECVSECEGV